MPSDHIGELKKWVAELARRRNEGETVRLNRAVELIAKNFRVQNHEVAVLALTPDEKSLRFLAPDNLRTVGQLPLSSGTSLAARTARDKRPELINHFSVVPHASVFEAVPISEERPGVPIHKIMSAPIIMGTKLVGVLQVSRKATLISEAGPDFTHAELRELKIVADAMAPCILIFNKE